MMRFKINSRVTCKGVFGISISRASLLAIAFLFLFLFLFVSCKEREDRRPLSGTSFDYIARSAKMMWAENALREVKTEINGVKLPKGSPPIVLNNRIETNGSLRIPSYRLYITTCNVEQDSFLGPGEIDNKTFDVLEFPIYDLLGRDFAEAPDFIIEAQLKQRFEERGATTRVAAPLRVNLILIDYRTTPIRDMSIHFSEDFMGINAGSSLNHLMLIESIYRRFIITGSKQVISASGEMSIDKFLSFSPMAPVDMFLRFKSDVKPSQPVSGYFTITMETLEGEVLTAKTRPVTLTP